MAKKRYVNTRDQSFFGNYIYDQVVPENHFLRLLNELIDWGGFTERLIDLYRGGGEYGRPPFNSTQLLKMGLLAFFYNLSDRQVEVYVNENLPAMYFVGLGVLRSFYGQFLGLNKRGFRVQTATLATSNSAGVK
jgi:transposase